MLDFLKSINNDGNSTEEIHHEEQLHKQDIHPQSDSGKVKVGSKEMTPEEYKQYQQFQRQFPDID